MKYQLYDLGSLKGGEIVEVALRGNAANVRLLDSTNFSYYKSGKRHQYYGGHVTKSPYQISVPRAGRWYVTIDFGGHAGKVSSSVNVLPGRLPEINQRSLSSVPSLLRDKEAIGLNGMDNIVREYDVFISHASEDKETFVRPLA